jgi:putative peptidoglycan lipid II flippase
VLTTMLASLLPEGSISHLYYADRLVQFPLGVFGVAVGTAALPALATLAARGETVRFRTALEDSLRLTLFISLPAAAGLAGMADPIVNILFGRGAFTDTAVQQTVLALWGYAPGLPAFAATRPLIAAFHARRDSATPVAAAVGGLAVTVGGGAVLMQFMGVAGLALAVSLGSWVNVVLLYRLFLRREQCGGFSFRWAAVYLLLSAGVWGAAAYSSFRFGAWSLIAIPVIIVFYAGSAMVCRSPDMRLLLRRQAAG